jgi:hypothetical protein
MIFSTKTEADFRIQIYCSAIFSRIDVILKDTGQQQRLPKPSYNHSNYEYLQKVTAQPVELLSKYSRCKGTSFVIITSDAFRKKSI